MKNCVEPMEVLIGFHLIGDTDSQGGLPKRSGRERNLKESHKVGDGCSTR